MTASNFHHRANPRREKTTRRAFILWMAAYVVALVAVATLHGGGGAPTGIAAAPGSTATQQARVIGEPQSSLADRLLPVPVALNVDG